MDTRNWTVAGIAFAVGLGVGIALMTIGPWGPARVKTGNGISQALREAEAHSADPDALRTLASLYMKAGSHQEAADWYARALVLNPADIESLLDRGYCLWKLGRHVDAMDTFRQAAAKSPGEYRAWYNMAVVLYDLKDPAEAQRALDTAVRLKPDLPGRETLAFKIRRLEQEKRH